MTYLGIIDYEHLDNALFLTTFAQSLDRHSYSEHNCIMLHGDSEYTTRIMQSGIMREEAVKRSIRGLNNRLVALLADEGISAIGLNGFQRELITRKNGNLRIDANYLRQLPTEPVWLISSLIQDLDREERIPLELPEMTRLIGEALDLERVYLFARKEEGLFDEITAGDKYRWDDLPDDFKSTYLPEEFQNYEAPVRLTTGQKFGNLKDEEGYIDIGG
jgi:hypothetical protein